MLGSCPATEVAATRAVALVVGLPVSAIRWVTARQSPPATCLIKNFRHLRAPNSRVAGSYLEKRAEAEGFLKTGLLQTESRIFAGPRDRELGQFRGLPHDCRLPSKKAVHSPRWDLFRQWFDERDQALMRVTNPQTGKPGPLGWLQIDVPDIRLKWEQVKAPFSGFKL